MKAKEILDIDFGKYQKVMISRVIVTNKIIKVRAEECGGDKIAIMGYIKGEHVMSVFYEKEDEVRVRDIGDGYLSISREERG